MSSEPGPTVGSHTAGAAAVCHDAAVMQPEVWRIEQAAHERRVRPWLEPRLQRRRAGLRHPVDDFLFEYYRLSPGQLLAWHPGWRHEVVAHPRLQEHPAYRRRSVGWGVDPAAMRGRARRLDAAIALLRATADRPAQFGCFGMHEWAMLYRTDDVRHRQVPLRISPTGIADTVATVGLRCTHFDAFRFFAPAAQRLQPRLTRASQPQTEQPGCVHAGMDLYRWAYEALPMLPSGLVADCFEFARAAREIDMRASPYDLAEWGLTPIEVETAAGRRLYAAQQRALSLRAQPLRAVLLRELTVARAWLDAVGPATAAAG